MLSKKNFLLNIKKINKNNKLNIMNISFNGIKKLISGEIVNVISKPMRLVSKKL